MSLSIKEALLWGKKKLRSERKRLECEILLASVLQKERVYLHTFDDLRLSKEQFEAFANLVDKAYHQEPIEYLTQRAGFYGYDFEVIEGVLIPRPETEILIEKAQKLIEKNNIKQVFELGVGSGIISITLALLCPQIEIIATDINPLALNLTLRNIERFDTQDHRLKERIGLYEIDVLKQEFDFRQTELFISNPPYIAEGYPLPKNVSYEPKSALFGGKKGDEILLNIIDLVQRKNIPFLACEMGYDQKESMQKALFGKAEVDFFCDWSGFDRGFVAVFLQ